jgi:hypothetical protein
MAALLITVATLGQMFGYWFALPEHIMDQAWPMHARFHIIQAVCWITGLDGAILVLAWWPLQHQERWSLWALLLLFLFAQTNHFIALLALPKGRPVSRGNWYDWMLGLDLVIFAVGLIWAATTPGML